MTDFIKRSQMLKEFIRDPYVLRSFFIIRVFIIRVHSSQLSMKTLELLGSYACMLTKGGDKVTAIPKTSSISDFRNGSL